MICPKCKSEYRPGIAHCPTCDQDLVHDGSLHSTEPGFPSAFREEFREDGDSSVPYCGFLTLEDARQARDHLRREGIGSDILIRDASDGASSAVHEEYWLRVPSKAFRAASRILGYHEVEPETGGEESTSICSECGETVGENETFCPHCGARFEE